MTILDYPGQPPRSTDDAEIIATLTRKGWTVRPEPPGYNPDTHEAIWDGSAWQIVPETLRAVIHQRIKQAARAHILASLPEWKQANATARGLELTRVGMTRALTEPEQAELAGLEYAWAWVKSIRTLSDVAEAELAGMTRAELDAWTEPSWPEWGA